jgi:hypothetical protein
MIPQVAGFPYPGQATGPDPTYQQQFAPTEPSQQFQAPTAQGSGEQPAGFVNVGGVQYHPDQVHLVTTIAQPAAPTAPPVTTIAQPAAPTAPPVTTIAQPAAPATPPQLSLDELATHWVNVKTTLTESATNWNRFETGMKGTLQKLENAIAAQIPVGTESISLQGMIFKPVVKTRFQTSEGQAEQFWTWIKDNNRPDLLDRRISQSAAAALVEQTKAWYADQVQHGTINPQEHPLERFFPPGFEIKRTPDLSVTKATRATNLVKE